MKKSFLIAAFFLLYAGMLRAQITLVQFSTGYNSPVDIQSAGDDRLFVVEQAGVIRICDTNGVRRATPFLNITSRVVSGGERGLLGLAFDPDYKNNGYFYVNYSRQTDGATRISRFSVSPSNPDTADPNSEQILLTIAQPFTNHNGGGLAFSPKDGYLYIGTGDGGSAGDPGNRAQNINELLGKMLRIDVRTLPYTNPPDNPYVGVAGNDEIWALGLRNPWRYSFDRWNYDLWIGDVGQNAWEEIHLQKASSTGGENYGWRCYEGNHPYNTSGCQPQNSYVPALYEYSHFAGGAAVVGGYVYRGAEYANMFGKYFLSDEYTGNYKVRMLIPTGTGSYNVDTSLGNMGITTVGITSFGEDRWGELYVADYRNGTGGQGRIFKFQGAACQPVAFLGDNDTMFITACDTVAPSPYVLRTPEGMGFQYQWYANGMAIPGNNNDTLLISQPGDYQVVVTNRSGCTATSPVMHVVNPNAPAININGLDTFYCTTTALVTMSGSPSGGVFTGPGISGNQFSPGSVGAGYHVITYTYMEPATRCLYSSSQTVHVDVCGLVDERLLFPGFTVYPNPAGHTLKVKFRSRQANDVKVEIRDVLGRTVYERSHVANAGAHVLTADISALPRGVYTLHLTNEKGSRTARFAKE